MRSAMAASVVAALLMFGAAAAHAEKRVFIIANNADGYGVDRCLATSQDCGRPAANADCRAREFGQALSFRKVDRDDFTGAIPTSGPGSCKNGACEDYVAIVCSR
jgi:hypothetical protein